MKQFFKADCRRLSMLNPEERYKKLILLFQFKNENSLNKNKLSNTKKLSFCHPCFQIVYKSKILLKYI